MKHNLQIYMLSTLMAGCSPGKFKSKDIEPHGQAQTMALNSVSLGDLPLNASGCKRLSKMISSAIPAQAHELDAIQKFGFVEDYTISIRGQSRVLYDWHGPVLLAENGAYYISVSAGQLWRQLMEIELGAGEDDRKREMIEKILNEKRKH